MSKKFEIRNSTAELLTLIAESKKDGVRVAYRDETIWATQQTMAHIFDVGMPTISKHLNILKSEEFVENSIIPKMKTTTNLSY